MAQVLELSHERAERVQHDEAKAKKKKARRLQRMKDAERKRMLVMGLVGRSGDGGHVGEGDGDEEMREAGGELEKEDDEDELSSSTDELTPSD